MSQKISKTKSLDNRAAQLRLMSDMKVMNENPPDGVSASPDDDDMFEWEATIFGPSDTEWEGGIYSLKMSFPDEYPEKAPKVKFSTKMFHPNVYKDGSLCLDILQDKWSPIYDVSSILTSIQSLLTDPNPDSPANPEAAELFNNDLKAYKKEVRKIAARSIE
eukprot:TRINITY_DN20409_c0_g1_i1.p1 TRINITY_DN20409_c0_g1~~TRINITY_DN20409_c0_g1_i1.p1  ORF type:complete len:175 (-),score=50.75 TRINITY_DN20409_c0_g1_i1:17-502(-)